MAARIKYDRVAYVDPHLGKDDAEVLYTYQCGRCGGTGHLTEYARIDNGVCYGCDGVAGLEFSYTVGDARKEAKRDVRYQNKVRLNRAKTEQYLAEAAAVRSEWATLTKDSDILTSGWGNDYVWENNPNYIQFVDQLWSQLNGFGKFDPKALSEKQIEAGADAIKRHIDRKQIAADREAAKADTTPVVEGKQTIAGTVYGAEYQETQYGTVYKFGIRQVNGQTYWGTIPAKIMNEMAGDWEKKLNGTNVVLEATVSPAREDHTHGFYKRPKLVSAEVLTS